MPYTPKTLTDCLQSLADRHESNGALPTSSATTSFWTRILNRGVAYCADKLRLEKSTTLTTVSGTIALPDDFLIINNVFDSSENELYMVDSGDVPSQTGYAYWITGNQTDGFALNTPNDKAYTVKYSFRPTEMSSGTDVCIIPDPEIPVSYAYSFIRKTESDPFEDADAALAECDARIKELQSQVSINSDSIGFTWN